MPLHSKIHGTCFSWNENSSAHKSKGEVANSASTLTTLVFDKTVFGKIHSCIKITLMPFKAMPRTFRAVNSALCTAQDRLRYSKIALGHIYQKLARLWCGRKFSPYWMAQPRQYNVNLKGKKIHSSRTQIFDCIQVLVVVAPPWRRSTKAMGTKPFRPVRSCVAFIHPSECF